MTATLSTVAEHGLLRRIRAGELMQTLTTNVYYWVDGHKGMPEQVSRDTSAEIDRLVSTGFVALGQSFTVKFGLNNFRFAALVLTHKGRHAAAGDTNTV